MYMMRPFLSVTMRCSLTSPARRLNTALYRRSLSLPAVLTNAASKHSPPLNDLAGLPSVCKLLENGLYSRSLSLPAGRNRNTVNPQACHTVVQSCADITGTPPEHSLVKPLDPTA